MNAGGRIADHRAALERRERSSEELARAALERASALNPTLNAFRQLLPDQAPAAVRAQDARRARAESPGPLAGILVALKDDMCLGHLGYFDANAIRMVNPTVRPSPGCPTYSPVLPGAAVSNS